MGRRRDAPGSAFGAFGLPFGRPRRFGASAASETTSGFASGAGADRFMAPAASPMNCWTCRRRSWDAPWTVSPWPRINTSNMLGYSIRE
jgi:hypothetical protein